MHQKRVEWASVEDCDYPSHVPLAVCNKHQEWLDVALYDGRQFKTYKYPHHFIKPTHYYVIPEEIPF